MSGDYSLAEIAAFLNAELRGDGDIRIQSLNTLQNAGAGELAFLANPKYARFLETTAAAAVILHPRQADAFSGNRLVVDNPYLGYAKLSAWFDPTPQPAAEIHPSAVVAESAILAEAVSIGPHAVIGNAVRIGAGSSIGANAVIGDDCKIGCDCRIAANVTLYHGVHLGDRVTIHSSSVIGADGFGFAPKAGGGWQKIHQIGGVRIGNDVEIGACTTIDRGAIGDTLIGNHVIIDNHVQIAHNVEVGDNTAMAAYAAVAGSSVIGKNCILAGDAGVVGHISLADGVQVMAKTLVTNSVTVPGSYSSGTPCMPTADWRKCAVRFSQLDQLARTVKKLDKNQND